MPIQINPLIKKPDQDNGFLQKAAPLVGAGIGAAVGGPAGASLGLGLGGALSGAMQKPQEMPSATPTVPTSDGSMSRRLQSLSQNQDDHYGALRDAALALPNLPPEMRQEAAHPIMTALINDAYGNGRA